MAAFRSARREYVVLGWVATGSVLAVGEGLALYLVGRWLARRFPSRRRRR